MCEVIKVDEFVELSGIAKKTLLRLLRSGVAPGRKVGREWLILREDVKPFTQKYIRGEI